MSDRARQRFRGPLRAVIFDWAGTVIDFGSRAPVAAVLEVFRSINLPVSVEVARAPMGMSKRDHLRAVLQSTEVQGPWQQVHGRPFDERDVDRIYEQFLPIQSSVLATHSALIPGCVETINRCRARGLRIGSSTGYTRELMEVLAPLAREQGFVPDAIVCADDVPAGRPAPWMCLENLRRLDVFPPAAAVNVDDTTVGVEAGWNAGMWSVGVAKSGNLLGLSEAEFNEQDLGERDERIRAARESLQASGAHFVIDTVADLPAVLDNIEQRLRQGERP